MGTVPPNGEPPAYVVVFDLAADRDALMTEPISDLQVRWSPPARSGTIDARRVIACGTLERIAEESVALQRLHRAPSVHRLLCVVRGRPQDHGAAGARLVLPEALDSLGVATVWVSDPRGVVWEVGSSRAKRLASFEPDPDGNGAFLHLMEVLRLPEVFDEVYARAGGGRVMSPAARVFVPGMTDERLLDAAELSALQTLTTAGEPTIDFARATAPPDVGGSATVPQDFFTRGGTVGTKTTALRTSWERAFVQLRRLRERPSQRQKRAAVDAVGGMAEAVRELKRELTELFEQVEASNGIDETERQLIRRAGVREQVLELFRAREAHGGAEEEKLRAYVLSEVAQVRSLPVVTGDLRALAREATPRSSEATVELIGDACPNEVIDRLGAAPRFPLHAEPSGLAALAGFGAAATWWPGVLRLVPALALLAVTLVFAWLATDGEWRGWRSWLGELKRMPDSGGFVVRVVALLFGIAAGLVVLLAIGDEPALQVAGVILAVALIGVYVQATWKHSVDRWVAEWGVARVAGNSGHWLYGYEEPSTRAGDETVVGRLLATARELIAVDWLRANERMEFAMMLTRSADALDAVRALLVEAERQRRDEHREKESIAPMPRCNPAVRADLTAEGMAELYRRSDVVEDIVLRDHLDAIARSIDVAWPLLTARIEADAAERVLDEFRPWLERYGTGLHTFGLFGHGAHFEEVSRDLLSGHGIERRRELLHAVWRGLELETLLTDDELLQYCRAEDLSLLDQDARYELVRFAPATSGPSAPVVRTASMLMAGVLRLVPLRVSAVEFRPDAPVEAGNGRPARVAVS